MIKRNLAFSLALLLLCSGCCVYVPSTATNMKIDPTLSNKEVASIIRNSTKSLYSYLSTPEWQYCTGYPQRFYDKKCSPIWNEYNYLANWWTGQITEYEEEDGIVELDYYSDLADRNVVSYGGRFERLDNNTLEIRVKSVGPYCSRMADEKVAAAWKKYLKDKFEEYKH